MCEKCLNPEFFLVRIFRIRTEYGDLLIYLEVNIYINSPLLKWRIDLYIAFYIIVPPIIPRKWKRCYQNYINHHLVQLLLRKLYIKILQSKSPYSVWMRENTCQEKLRIWTRFTKWIFYGFKRIEIFLFDCFLGICSLTKMK